jgi:hypothetical protein
MATEFTIGDHTYSAGRMDAMNQLYVGMKVAPLVSNIAGNNATLGAFAEALARAPMEDVEFITRMALKTIKRKSGDAWTDVYNQAAGKLMFEDISGADIMELAYMALKDGITPFFSRLVKLVLGTNPQEIAT